MTNIKTKYNVGDNVYAFTKNGLELKTIRKISISLKESGQVNFYLFEEFGDIYHEDQILADYPKAKKRLEDNANQLVLALK